MKHPINKCRHYRPAEIRCISTDPEISKKKQKPKVPILNYDDGDINVILERLKSSKRAKGCRSPICSRSFHPGVEDYPNVSYNSTTSY